MTGEITLGTSNMSDDDLDCGCDNPVSTGLSQEIVPEAGVTMEPVQWPIMTTSPTTLTVGGVIPASMTINFAHYPGHVSGPATMGQTGTYIGKNPNEDDKTEYHVYEDGICQNCMGKYNAPLPGLLVPRPEDMAVDEPYGDVRYADNGFRDNKKRYPIDTPAHIRAAWAYINVPKNAGMYTSEQLELIKGRIRAAAKRHGIEIAESGSHEGSGAMGMAVPYPRPALTAGAAPLAPPAAWFENPNLQAPTKLTITDDGRVFGHLAQWRVCHVGIGNACVMAPKSQTDYQVFNIGSVKCDNGQEVPIGKIVMGTAHANAQWGVMPSREHYDNTALTAAVVRVGEDRHGIWVSGALTTDMTPEKIASLRASALSGDWRTVNGNLELIAALAVNSPGFPIFSNKDGRTFSLQAVGVVGMDEGEETPEASGDDDMTTFSNATNTEFATPPTGVVDEETDARMLRLQAIEESRQEHERERRMGQLAVLDEEREKLAADLPKRDSVMIRSQYRDAQLTQLLEDEQEIEELDETE